MFPHARMMHNPFNQFQETYRCNGAVLIAGFSIAMLQGQAGERVQVNHGGKSGGLALTTVILPPSALAKLTQLNIEYPMLFELSNKNKSKSSHAGVLEFIAEEGRVYIPAWMLRTLQLEEGSLISVRSTSLALGKFVKIQPQSPAFLDITDPKAVLEQSFRNFSCLTIGDVITILYNDTLYEILVMETKPSDKGISIIETDLEVRRYR
ncbi:ubiquitin fusion degradation protein [Kappamyces sp. JEL0680]|nr:ubiquitin fusion degradation protein [Kappamyces sp. JEL0680]